MSAAALSPALRRAIEHQQAGRGAPAEALCREILGRDPNCVAAVHLFGVIAFQFARHAEAAGWLRRAQVLAPSDPAIHINLGAVYRSLGRIDESVACFEQALVLKPGDPSALSNLGNVLAIKGRLDEAFACLQQAIALQPDNANAHNNLGHLFTNRCQFEEAVACFQRALALKPDFALAHNNLGNALLILGRLDEALRCFQRALALQPDFVEAHNNLGSLLGLRGQVEEAVAAYRRALAFQPDRPDIHSNLILFSHYQCGHDAGAIRAEHRRWNLRHAVPLAPFIRPHANARAPDRRLRIGYVSPDFRDHVVGFNLLPLFECHAHEQFEIFSYAHVPASDDFTARFRACSDHWRDIAPLTDPELADLVRRDEIDILVDLALHTARNRLLAFARKPAPIQVSFAGYPTGTGLDAIDYHLTDPRLEPPTPGDDQSSDAPFRLPDTFWCYRPRAPDLAVRPLPALADGRVTFGCLNNFCKINDPTLQLWAQVLLAVPGSRLLLLIPEGALRQRTLKVLAHASLGSDRVNFVDRQPREKYLKLYDGVDLGLDTFPYNGHTTSLDAYWMGVPVVTLVGPTGVSRAGWSQLFNLGLTELAAHTPDEFVVIATALARDLARLAALRASLRGRMQSSPLMDAPRFARGIEAAYRTMWRKWCDTPRPGGATRQRE